MRSLQHVLAAAILVLSIVTSVWAGPFEEAIAAYNREDYASALQLLRPLAESGNVRAQFLLGFMYEGGMGVPKDDTEAAKWYQVSSMPSFVSCRVAYIAPALLMSTFSFG